MLFKISHNLQWLITVCFKSFIWITHMIKSWHSPIVGKWLYWIAKGIGGSWAKTHALIRIFFHAAPEEIWYLSWHILNSHWVHFLLFSVTEHSLYIFISLNWHAAPSGINNWSVLFIFINMYLFYLKETLSFFCKAWSPGGPTETFLGSDKS